MAPGYAFRPRPPSADSFAKAVLQPQVVRLAHELERRALADSAAARGSTSGGSSGTSQDSTSDLPGTGERLPTLAETRARMRDALAAANATYNVAVRLQRAANIVAWVTHGAVRQADLALLAEYEARFPGHGRRPC